MNTYYVCRIKRPYTPNEMMSTHKSLENVIKSKEAYFALYPFPVAIIFTQIRFKSYKLHNTCFLCGDELALEIYLIITKYSSFWTILQRIPFSLCFYQLHRKNWIQSPLFSVIHFLFGQKGIVNLALATQYGIAYSIYKRRKHKMNSF